MSVVRVYEFSKKSGIPNKDILALLKKGGFSVASHMAALDENALAYLEKETQVTKKDEEKKASPSKVETPKKEATAQPTKNPSVAEPTRPNKGDYRSEGRREEPVKEKIETSATIEVRPMTVEEIAEKLRRPVTDVILVLLRKGIMAPKNMVLAEKVLADLVRHYGFEVSFPSKSATTTEKRKAVSEQQLEERMPVVVVMGHVDHGKTTLLDYIRKTRVAVREKGGITQHLGAYEVDLPQGGIVFLDTPGHEAFTQIRARGTTVADIAILVVAADDSVKPQTVEAIRLARSMELPIIVAVNKIDKTDPQRVDVVKRDLAQYELLPEEWGGSTLFVPISAKFGTGVEELLELLALQSQMMELKANPNGPAIGTILESKLEKGRGPVATVICQEGVVKTGDFFVCGSTQGKVTAIIDSMGRNVALAGPSVPVQISGFDEIAGVGDVFEVISENDFRKARASKGERKGVKPRAATSENSLNLIIKTDGNASREALLGALRGVVGKDDKEIYVVHSGVGNITEGDVLLAANTGSMIVGLHVKSETNAGAMAQREQVTIKRFDIIYKLLDELRDIIQKSRKIALVKKKIGEAEVRKVFDIKGLGVIAGCFIKEGIVTRDASVVVWRGRERVGEGKIRSLQREKKNLKEIQAGYECAFIVDGFTDWAVGDRVECFVEVPQS
jgi:translation initiation factor IF-2